MKPNRDLRKPAKRAVSASDDLKMGRKLKPVKKEKNVKRALLQEIDELEDIELNYPTEDITDQDVEDENPLDET